MLKEIIAEFKIDIKEKYKKKLIKIKDEFLHLVEEMFFILPNIRYLKIEILKTTFSSFDVAFILYFTETINQINI